MIKSICLLLVLTLIEIIVFHYYIKYLKEKKYTQTVRTLGPTNHYSKNGTPTAGGLIIVLFLIIDFLTIKIVNNYYFNYKDLIFIITVILFSILGVLDDIKIINKRNNEGLKPKFKIILECMFIIILYIIMKRNNYDNVLTIGHANINLGLFSVLFIIFYVIAWSNSFNITDGLDGLASSLSLPLLVGLFIIGKMEKNELLVISALCMFFSIIGFLVFNFHPALVFMGNVGSHAIGAGIGVIGILTKNEITLAIMGLVFVFETISVILQVLYFKKTKGKRLFKMAPFHHHLELIGYNEHSISFILVLISIMFVILSLIYKGI